MILIAILVALFVVVVIAYLSHYIPYPGYVWIRQRHGFIFMTIFMIIMNHEYQVKQRGGHQWKITKEIYVLLSKLARLMR